jgi:hypothetical protein
MPDHEYISDACFHEFHGACRLRCEVCNASCRCDCHDDGDEGEYREKLVRAFVKLTE